MELITAIATKPAREVQTRYGARYVVDARLETGESEAIWGPTDMDGLGSIRQGQQFLVGRHRSGKLSFVDSQPEAGAPAVAPRPLGFQTQPVAPAQPAGMSADLKAAIAADIQQYAAIYSHCYSVATASMPPQAPAEAVQSCASSVWIAVSRRHSLT